MEKCGEVEKDEEPNKFSAARQAFLILENYGASLDILQARPAATCWKSPGKSGPIIPRVVIFHAISIKNNPAERDSLHKNGPPVPPPQIIGEGGNCC